MRIPLSVSEESRPVYVEMKNQYDGLIFQPDRLQYIIRTKGKGQRFGKKSVLKDESGFYVTIKHAGNYEIKLCRVKVYGPLGFLYLIKPMKITRDLRILPRLYSVPVVITQKTKNFWADENETKDDLGESLESKHFSQIREFMDGDKLESIHWKISAKMNDLMVKESPMIQACATVILLDTSNEAISERKFQGFLEVATSLSFSLMNLGCPHYVAWYDSNIEDVVRIRVDDEENFYLFMNYYFATPSERSYDPEPIYQEKYRHEQILHILKVGANLSIYQNGSLVTKVNSNRIKDELEHLELIL